MKSHRFDPISFVFGLGLTVVGMMFLIPATPRGAVDLFVRFGAWVWPAVLLAVGAAIILSAITAGRSDRNDG